MTELIEEGEALGSSALGRRAFLGASAAAAAAGVTLATAKSAHAADPAYAPGKYPVDTPTAEELHFIKRFTYGYTPATLAALRSAGGAEQWFSRQLNPGTIPDNGADELENWWPCLKLNYDEIWARDKAEVEPVWVAMMNYARWVAARRRTSERQLLEVMTEFWEHHLYVPIHDDSVFLYRIDYGKKIRDLALTSFEELLQMSTVHPCMGLSLDNAGSRKQAVNENLGRELLELHTVGQGNYTQTDVRNSSLILTGFRVNAWGDWKSFYDPSWHYTGKVQIMDFSHANTSTDGRDAVKAYLSYLALHPKTARRIATRMAKYFVSDTPSAALIDKLTQVYMDNRSAVKPMLQALVASAEFQASANMKIRTPTEDSTNVYRQVQVKFGAPTAGEHSGINSSIYESYTIGQGTFTWPRPDGQPYINDAWNSPSRFLGSFHAHWSAAGGWWPTKDTTWKDRPSWLPKSSITVRDYVDYLSRTVLGEPSTEELLKAVCVYTKYSPSTVVTASHPLCSWAFPMLMVTILDSPTNFVR